MNLHIKDKFELIDLARPGTQARKYVRPYVMISSSAQDSVFKEGDILDANATTNLVNDVVKSSIGGIKCVILTQAEYDALEYYDPNTIYFIIEGE